MIGNKISATSVNLTVDFVGRDYNLPTNLWANLSEQPWYLVDSAVTSLYHGIDWVYTTVETLTLYDFNLWYFNFHTSMFDDSYDFFFYANWYFSILTEVVQASTTHISDSYLFSTLIPGHYTDRWFQTMLASRDLSLVMIHHPESFLIATQMSNSVLAGFWAYWGTVLYDFIEAESLYIPTCVLIHLVFVILLAAFFMFIYFSYFTSIAKEEATIDYDYAVATASVEAEKEITGFDDILLGMVSIFLILCWYFYVHCWIIVSNVPELIFFWYLLPCLIALIIGVPFSLAYDFGALFLAYLRGVGSTPLMFYELMFDYIGVVIFFTRIVIQLIRIILILFAYVTMHDFILYEAWTQRYYVQYENFWEELAQVSFTFGSISYYTVFTLVNRISYWIYEVLHTFFVVTAQCTAFFAIVFWLYLFLYTMFVAAKQENYFTPKRMEIRAYYSKLH